MARGTEDVVEVAKCLAESWDSKLRTSLRIVEGTLSLSLCASVRHGITTIESKVLSVLRNTGAFA